MNPRAHRAGHARKFRAGQDGYLLRTMTTPASPLLEERGRVNEAGAVVRRLERAAGVPAPAAGPGAAASTGAPGAARPVPPAFCPRDLLTGTARRWPLSLWVVWSGRRSSSGPRTHKIAVLLSGVAQSSFNLGARGALYASTPEVYPAEMRVTGAAAV